MKNAERNNVAEAVQQALGLVRNDWEKMGGVSKRLRKAANKARIQDFQNNAFNKKAKK